MVGLMAVSEQISVLIVGVHITYGILFAMIDNMIIIIKKADLVQPFLYIYCLLDFFKFV